MRPETMFFLTSEVEGFLANANKSFKNNLERVKGWASYGIGKSHMTEERQAIIDLQEELCGEIDYCLSIISRMRVNYLEYIKKTAPSEPTVKETRWLYVDDKLVEVSLEEAAKAQGITPDELLAREEDIYQEYFSDPRSRISVYDDE